MTVAAPLSISVATASRMTSTGQKSFEASPQTRDGEPDTSRLLGNWESKGHARKLTQRKGSKICRRARDRSSPGPQRFVRLDRGTFRQEQPQRSRKAPGEGNAALQEAGGKGQEPVQWGNSWLSTHGVGLSGAIVRHRVWQKPSHLAETRCPRAHGREARSNATRHRTTGRPRGTQSRPMSGLQAFHWMRPRQCARGEEQAGGAGHVGQRRISSCPRVENSFVS